MDAPHSTLTLSSKSIDRKDSCSVEKPVKAPPLCALLIPKTPVINSNEFYQPIDAVAFGCGGNSRGGPIMSSEWFPNIFTAPLPR